MAENDSATKEPNGVMIEEEEEEEELTLFSVLNRLMSAILYPPDHPQKSSSVLQRIKESLSGNVPLLPAASRNSARRLLTWTSQGTPPLRALLVVSVGTITILTLTGLLVFMLFFAAATVNAVVISLLMSLAAAGGFLALFFTCVAAIYVGALSVALFVISTATISAIIAVLIAAGWIGFFWTLFLAARKSIGVAKHSVSMTGSALSAYSTAWQSRHQNVPKKSD